jgi:hypothetical protein
MTGAKSLPAARARHVLVDRLGIITEQAPPYCPSAKGTVEALLRWMTQRFERQRAQYQSWLTFCRSGGSSGGDDP